MKAIDIMTRSIDYVLTNDTVSKAAQLMRDSDIGAVPVLDGNRIAGIITDRDLVIRVVASQRNPSTVSVGEVMSKNVHYCNEFDDIEYVAEIMENYKIRRIIVRNSDGLFTGIISLGDLAEYSNNEISGDVLKHVSEPIRSSH